MLRGLIHRYGSVSIMVATTALCVLFSVATVTSASLLFGYEQLRFAIAISAIVPLVIAPTVFFGFLRLLERLDHTESELQQAVSNVRTLSGLLPICASCKKVRDDQGYWNRIEDFLGKHSSAEFSHGFCPDCEARQSQEMIGSRERVGADGAG